MGFRAKNCKLWVQKLTEYFSSFLARKMFFSEKKSCLAQFCHSSLRTFMEYKLFFTPKMIIDCLMEFILKPSGVVGDVEIQSIIGKRVEKNDKLPNGRLGKDL